MKSKFGLVLPWGAVSFACGTVVTCVVACSSDGLDLRDGDPIPGGTAGSMLAGHGGTSAGPSEELPSRSGGTMTGNAGSAQGGTSGDSGASSSDSGASSSDSGASSSDSGASSSDSGVDTGGTAHGGTAPGGAAGSGIATGGAAGSGTAGSGAQAGADTGAYPAITLAGLTTAVELAPVRLAATGIYPAKVNVTSGGVDSLFVGNPPLVATNAETQALRASVQHTNLRIIFTVCEGLYRIVAKKSAGINTLADLKGKTVDYSSGTSSAYFLHRMLGLVNLSESDVKIGSAPSASSRGQAAAYWEPNMQQYAASISAADRVEFQKDDQGREVYRELFNLHATAESLADPSKRRTIVGFVRSLIIASERIRSDPTVVYPLLTGPTGVSQAVLQQSFKYERYAGTLVSDALDQLVSEEVWHAKNNNRKARSRAELATLIDASVVQDALGQ